MDSLPEEILKEILLRVVRPSLYYTSRVCSLLRKVSLGQVVLIKTEQQFWEACLTGDRLSIIRATIKKDWLNGGVRDASRRRH